MQGSASNRVTAGGPSLLDVLPAAIAAGADATVTLRGLNLSPSSRVQAGVAVLNASFTDGALQRLEVVIPSSLLSASASLPLKVVDPGAPAEPPSNTVTLTVQK